MYNQQIIIYQTEDGNTSVNVLLEEDTVWLTQREMQDLFGQTKQNISLHILNVFNEGELSRALTVKESLTVQQEGKRPVTRKVSYYSLDVIISVGYRVKSKRGTQFRIWANRILKDYLTKGYALNEQKLKERTEEFEQLKQTIHLLGSIVESKKLSGDEATGLLKVITDYAYALDILDRYDHQQLEVEATTIDRKLFFATYELAMEAIKGLRVQFGGSSLFGNEKDDSFKSSIGTIYQSFDGVELYPSIEEKAAHLLYFVVKNHSFSDGNKRIAAWLFVWFLQKNGILYRPDGSKRIADNTLVALTLMIAESKPEEMKMIVKVVVNLINQKN